MAFVVINSIPASAEDLSQILAEVQALGFDTLRAQPGFKSARLLKAENQTEVRLIIEWESRDHFVAYRQSPTGRSAVERAAALHPQISFYDVVVGLDSKGH